MLYVIPKLKTQDKKTSMFSGAKLWNRLSVNIKSIEDNDNFKNKYKTRTYFSIHSEKKKKKKR